jgi:hypothetical protein
MRQQEAELRVLAKGLPCRQHRCRSSIQERNQVVALSSKLRQNAIHFRLFLTRLATGNWKNTYPVLSIRKRHYHTHVSGYGRLDWRMQKIRLLGLDETNEAIIIRIIYSAVATCSLQKYKEDIRKTNVCE